MDAPNNPTLPNHGKRLSRVFAILAPQTLVGHDARQKVPDSSGAGNARGHMRKGTSTFSLIYAFMFLVLGTYFFPKEMYPLHQLHGRGVRVEGRLLHVYPPRGRGSSYFSYGFHVNGKPYEAYGHEFGAIHRPPQTAPSFGDPVDVYYLPDNPSTSTAGDPGRQLVGWYLIALFWAAVTIAFFWLSRYARRREAEQKKAALATAVPVHAAANPDSRRLAPEREARRG